MDSSKAHQLLARLSTLHKKCNPDEAWRIEQEPHDYPDGTTHFTHVRMTGHAGGESVRVSICSHVTPELAELIVLMRNNLPDLIAWAKAGIPD